MKELTREMFEARAASGGIVPVYREYLADMETPVSVLSRAVDEDVFLLESVASSETGGRYSFLGVNPYATVYEKDGTVFMQTPADGVSFLPDADILAALRRLFAERNFKADPDLPPLQGGAIGYLSYDAVRVFEPRVQLTPEAGTPTAAFILTDSILVFDNVRRTVTVIVNIDASAPVAYDVARERIDALFAKFFRRERPAMRFSVGALGERALPGGFTPEMTAEEYADIVAKCKKDILNGECIQVVPSQKFTMEPQASPIALYRALRVVNPSPYNFFMKVGTRTLIGSSPEELVKLSGRTCSTCPIAGTRPRGAGLLRARRALLARDAPRLGRLGHARGGQGRLRPPARRVPRRHAHGRAEDPRDGAHRPVREVAARHLRRRGRLLQLHGRHGLRHRHPHDDPRRHAPHDARRRRHRGGLRPREGVQRNRQQVKGRVRGRQIRGDAMILMIDNYDSFTYNLVQYFRGLGAEMDVVRNDKIDVDGIRALKPQALVLSPGPGNPDSAGVTLAAIKAFAGELPLFGICLGHQSIAQAFGARIVHAKRLMHGKTSPVHHDGKGVFRDIPQEFAAMRYHSLAVDPATLPAELRVSATASDDGEVMGIRHATLPVEGVQYHPESIGTPTGMQQLKNFLEGLA